MPATQQFASIPVKVGVPSLSPPKKQRRRRSAASGAADDCHACRDNSIKCDRQRPYCQQCLDMGKSCSGYKQALTWNQGIASRGHLRGLSSPAAQRSVAKPEDRRSRPRSQLSNSPKPPTSAASPLQKPEHEMKGKSFLRVDQKSVEMLSPGMISPACMMPMYTPDWQLPSPSISENFSHLQNVGKSYEINEPLFYVQPMQGLQVPQHPRLCSISEGSGSISSASGISEMDWPSPSEYPQTPDLVPRPVPNFSPAFSPSSKNALGIHSSARNSFFDPAPTSCPEIYTSSSLDGNFPSDGGNGVGSTEFGTLNGMDDLGLCGLSGIVFDDEARNGTASLSDIDIEYGFDFSLMSHQPTSPFIYDC